MINYVNFELWKNAKNIKNCNWTDSEEMADAYEDLGPPPDAAAPPPPPPPQQAAPTPVSQAPPPLDIPLDEQQNANAANNNKVDDKKSKYLDGYVLPCLLTSYF